MLRLYSYWRSSSAYRVRIALNLKGLAYETVPIHLVRDGGEQFLETYRRLNPQSRVPLLADGDFIINQSQAILEYLEAVYPQPALVPADARGQARVRAFCLTIAADIQPLQNTSVLKYLGDRLHVSEDARSIWLRHWIGRGLSALELELQGNPDAPFVFGATPTWADCVLVPQIYAAERFGCDAAQYPRLARIAGHCNTLPAFQRAHPDVQPDTPSTR